DLEPRTQLGRALQQRFDLARRAAAEARDANDAAGWTGGERGADQPAEVGDAILVRLGGRLARETHVERLPEQALALGRRAVQHVHHFVIAGVAERLFQRAPHERRLLEQRIERERAV